MIEERTTACPLDCPDACSLSVTVDVGELAETNTARIVAIDAGPGHELTDGWICQKVKHHDRRVYAPERVMTPLVRTGLKGAGEFRSASWSEALELVGRQLRATVDQHGAQAIVPYLYGSSAPTTQQMLGRRLWRRVGASVVDPTICAATHAVAYASLFGSMLSSDPSDVAFSDVVVVWGANPTVANVHFAPLVTRAHRDRGTTVIVVDPRRTAMAKRADQHLAVKPGTDVVLALAVARELRERDALATEFLADHAEGVAEFLAAAESYTLETAASITGISIEAINNFVTTLVNARTVLYRVGWGIERNRNGGSACAAVFALPVLAGHFGRRGSGIVSSLSEAAPVAIPWTENDRRRHAVKPRHFNMNTFGASLCDTTLDPPIKVLFVQGSNLAATSPDQVGVLRGLQRDDLFTVVHDQVLTDTTRYADVVLPATTHFETHDVATSYGSFMLQEITPVIQRVGESRSDNEVSSLLAMELGEPREEFDPEPSAVIAASVHDGGLLTRTLRAEGTSVQFVDTFPSYPGGKVRLAQLPDIGVPRFVPLESKYPLVLLTPASPKTINSMFGEFQDVDPAIRMHPEDAVARGLSDAQRVCVMNDLASVATTVRFDSDLQMGVAVMPKGAWCRSYEGGLTANALVPDTLSDLAGGACFNDARVEVESA